ncbi:MAG TPA: hypothetical protein VN721_07035 [Flavipsychrobacter sp.]|nr:hypothetical protein [Flavipsychrobacter sp.]
MKKEPTDAEIYNELYKIKSSFIESFNKYLISQQDGSFIRNNAASEEIKFTMGNHSIEAEFEIKPFAKALFIETIINEEKVKELNIIYYADHTMKQRSNNVLKAHDFQVDYYQMIIECLKQIEDKELQEFCR